MGVREKARFRRLGVIAVAVLVALLALGIASPAVAKKKKKKKVQPAVTVNAAAPLSSSSSGPPTANCGGKPRLSGGCFIVSSHLDPSSNTGLRAVSSTSSPVG